MTPLIRHLPIFLLTAVSLAEPTRASDGPATRPSQAVPRNVDAEARKAVEAVLADAKTLRLSMDKESAAARFQFHLTLAVPAADGRFHSTRYIVARDGGDVAALVVSAEGDPFAYATTNLWVGFDPTDRGRLVAYEKGAPRFLFGLAENGHSLEMELSFVKGLEAPELRVDVASLLKGAMDQAEEATYLRAERLIRVKTKRMAMSVALPTRQAKDGFSVSRLTVLSKAGATMTLSDVQVGGDRPAILGVDKAAFERAGLAVRTIGETEPPKVPVFVPPGFGTDAKERAAAGRISGIFPSIRERRDGPTTRDGALEVKGGPGAL